MYTMISCFIQRSSKCLVKNMSTITQSGIDLKEIVKFLESFAPLSLAEKWDNTGLLLEPLTPTPVNCILLTNDLTEDVIDEALNAGVNLILSYHPPIFSGLKTITSATWKERIISACLENKIAVYSPHTAWDSVPGGVNDWIADAFKPTIINPILQNASYGNSYGIGRYCYLKPTISISEAVQIMKKLTSLQFLNLALARGANLGSKIEKVAICAGSGNSVLANVEADLFVTGEMSHHSILDAVHKNTSIILCNHSNSERGFLKEFAKKLEAEYEGVKVIVSCTDRDPINII